MARILVAEDKASMRAVIGKLLGRERPGDVVELAADGAIALERLAAVDYDLVLTDVRLPGADGFDVLRVCREIRPDTEVVLMTAYATVDAAVEAVKAGAYDYLAKPFEPDALLLKIARALERRELRSRARAAEAALHRRDALSPMLGDSAPMRVVRRLIERVATLDVTVLITGASGTGKEIAAQAIHNGSAASGPFVPINCGAIPDSLVESELFGHARGAFTGATAVRVGLVEQAAAGTLFLDEVGDLPLDVQVKLNRALQERTYRRVGEVQERRVEARIVAATHRDLRARVAEGAFREDLFFRLHVYPIEMPPLRERGEDLFLLARHFLELASARYGRDVRDFSPAALRVIADDPWPGNVRELQHAVERAVIVAESSEIEPGDLPVGLGSETPSAGAPDVHTDDLARLDYRNAMAWARERAARRYLDALMRRFEGNVTHAADQAGVGRETLHRLLKKSGIEAASYRRGRDIPVRRP